jgi:UDP-MurNAc hydroxylase
LRITFLGHAGLFIETRQASILCDPWFNPAYFGSWLPFPSNEHVDLSAISRPTFLYISHLHQDHLDATFLRDHVAKDAVVLLPDYPLDLLARTLRMLGFERFITLRNGQNAPLAGLRLAILAMVAPTDGPIGDSGLVVDDGETCIYDQNDSRPTDVDRLAGLGPFDAHFIQFSGAIWFPFVYQYPQAMLEALGRKKRANEMARALRYIRSLDARWVFPNAGPPCFLDDQLFELNDFTRSPSNTFPDQAAFLEHMVENGIDRGRLLMPGSTVSLEAGQCSIEPEPSVTEIAQVFGEKRAYLGAYKARKQAEIDAIKRSLPRTQVELLPALREWFEPLLDKADVTCAGVAGIVALDLGADGIAIDFRRRRVEAWDGGEWDYYFKFDRSVIEYCVLHHLEDWVNSAFLSCRFEARRKGPYNEYLYNFFKCLSMERLQYAEGFYVEQSPVDQFWEVAGYQVQRRCPHLKADLSRFGQVADGILTCTLHGWQFELETGRCLTADDRHLYSRSLARTARTASREVELSKPVSDGGATVRPQCGHCFYDRTLPRRTWGPDRRPA